MSYQVFARKYRPRTFEDVLGQDHVVRTLRNAIEKERIAQAYLFVGPRGTGKTSTARILAKALNCPDGPRADFDPNAPLCQEIAEGRSLDVLEIDGASNNGVEQVRELRETVQYSPAQGRYKIYYIDEVHMLSNAAFNALLKTLEEPPPHVKFIFATTEPHKVLPTIVSRCQRFDLRRIPDEIIAGHLLHIARAEDIRLSDTAAAAIARGAEGGMRDAQSMLDQLVAFCGESIAETDVEEVFGITSWETVAELARQLLNHSSAAALASVRHHHEAGRDLSRLLADLIRHWRNLIVWQVDGGESLGELGATQREALAAQAQLADTEHLLLAADELSATLDKLRWASDARLQVDLGLVRTIRVLESVSLDDVLGFLEKQGADPKAPLPARSISRPVAAPPIETAPVSSPPVEQRQQADATPQPPPQPQPQDKTPEDQSPHRAELVAIKPAQPAAAEPVKSATPTESTSQQSVDPISFDGPLRNPNPEPDSGEDEAVEKPYDDSGDYDGGLLDALSGQLDQSASAAPAAKTTPAPEPGPTPAGDETPVEAIPLDDLTDFWRQFCARLPEQLGMVADAAAHGLPLALEDDLLVVGLPPSQKFAFDSYLRRPPETLVQALSEAAGRPLALEFRLDDSVPEPDIPEPEPIELPQPKKPEPTARKPEPETRPDPAAEFDNDPDIQRALKIFEAEVLGD